MLQPMLGFGSDGAGFPARTASIHPPRMILASGSPPPVWMTTGPATTTKPAIEPKQVRRKVRKTYRFSKDWEMHNASTYFSMYSYNFCWPVRTLRQRGGGTTDRRRTPAMAAGLADHVWTLSEWLTFPAKVQ